MFSTSVEYCVHDKDLMIQMNKEKVHVHIIIAFPNTLHTNMLANFQPSFCSRKVMYKFRKRSRSNCFN